jgi:hypothetical protein
LFTDGKPVTFVRSDEIFDWIASLLQGVDDLVGFTLVDAGSFAPWTTSSGVLILSADVRGDWRFIWARPSVYSGRPSFVERGADRFPYGGRMEQRLEI